MEDEKAIWKSAICLGEHFFFFRLRRYLRWVEWKENKYLCFGLWTINVSLFLCVFSEMKKKSMRYLDEVRNEFMPGMWYHSSLFRLHIFREFSHSTVNRRNRLANGDIYFLRVPARYMTKWQETREILKLSFIVSLMLENWRKTIEKDHVTFCNENANVLNWLPLFYTKLSFYQKM